MTTIDLVLERREQENETPVYETPEGAVALVTPPISEDYWQYRVRVADGQAVVGFPKFFTIGIGFAVEGEDWNANLPYTMDAARIRDHIWENRGPNIPDDDEGLALVTRAIEMIQAAIAEDGGV